MWTPWRGSGLMALLSPELKCEVVTQMSERMLSSVWYFQGLEADCMVELALRMSRLGYAPREHRLVGRVAYEFRFAKQHT